MKRLNLRRADRRLLAGAAISLVSLAIFCVGLIAVVSAVTDNPVQLPSEGSFDEIVQDGVGPGALDAVSGTGAVTGFNLGPLPERIAIPVLYIDAPIIVLGFEEGTNTPAVPQRADQVAWYNFTSTPGLRNNAVFAGHVDWQTRNGSPIPGAFYRLRELKIGDSIDVTLRDGQVLHYKVTGNVATDYNDPNLDKIMAPTEKDVITLITCGGTWIKDPSEDDGGNYSHRVIVRAERVIPGAVS